VSVAGLCCYKPGQPSRLIYRTLLYRGLEGEPKGFCEPDLIRLLDAAHQQLQALDGYLTGTGLSLPAPARP
jgi:hypothetical protein